MTNYEAIKAMPEELFAYFLGTIVDCDKCLWGGCMIQGGCKNATLEWLRSEVVDADTTP